ncbi:alpha/beta hydrolase fold domain-containing protein [Acinetobacter baumannii]
MAGHDVLHDEAKIYSHKLRQNGVKMYYEEFPDQTHGFINLTRFLEKQNVIRSKLVKTLESFGIK